MDYLSLLNEKHPEAEKQKLLVYVDSDYNLDDIF
jgi:hypothetical protein